MPELEDSHKPHGDDGEHVPEGRVDGHDLNPGVLVDPGDGLFASDLDAVTIKIGSVDPVFGSLEMSVLERSGT